MSHDNAFVRHNNHLIIFHKFHTRNYLTLGIRISPHSFLRVGRDTRALQMKLHGMLQKVIECVNYYPMSMQQQ